MAHARIEPPTAPPADRSGPGDGIYNAVVGTAGHIDHGKSLLVRALTGIDPDRLKEEQERGITIDLGFAPLELADGRRVGIIDVPGHEKFVKNMVAGATGIDFAILVVAADDGVMAQTREHLDILKLLGVSEGLVAITKVDLVEEALIEAAREEIERLVAGSCLEGKPILSVSAKTGQGLDKFRAALERSLGKLERRSAEGLFRMPIQRVFAKEGFGAVITGVPLSGRLAVCEEIEVLPPGTIGRVKGMHAYKHKIEFARAGHSTALNVAGLERSAVARGMVACAPGILRPTRLVTARLLHLGSAPYALKQRAPVRFHAGTAEIMGKVLLLDHELLPPGAEGWIQIALEEPTVVCPGDRYILRHQSPMVTLGGGQIISGAPRKRRRFEPAELEDLDARRRFLGHPQELLSQVLGREPRPASLADLAAELGARPEDICAWATALESAGRVIALKAGEIFVSSATFQRFGALARKALEAFFQAHPALDGMDKLALRKDLLEAARKAGLSFGERFDELLAALERAGSVRIAGGQVALVGRERKLDARWAERAKEVQSAIQAGGNQPPSLDQLPTALGIPERELREVLRYLYDRGELVEVAKDLAYPRATLHALIERTGALFAERPEQTMSGLRQGLGLNRKCVVPLLEYMDKAGLTKRIGDLRRWIGPTQGGSTL